MADICSVASVCAFLKKSNTMCSWVVVLLLLMLFMLRGERCMCCVFNEAGGWKHEVGVRVIIVMIASSDMVVMLLLLSRCCVDDLILYLIYL